MRRKPIVLTAVLAALVAPAIAFAGFPGGYLNEYEGDVESDSNARFGFDVSRKSGTKFIHRVDVHNVPAGCMDGTAKRLSRPFPEDSLLLVSRGEFAGTIEVTGATPAKVKIQGKLLSGERAKGTLRLRTSGPLDSDDCYTGILRWKDNGV